MRFLRRWAAHFATPRLLIEIASILVALYAADRFLAALEQRELDAEARHSYEAGESLLRQGRKAEAIEALIHAHATDRDNRNYAFGLAGAYLANKQPQRAALLLDDVLDDDSNDGRANLLMARVTSQEQRFADTDSYYHRAIYGAWPPNDPGERDQVRLELAQWLADHQKNQELLSELLLLDQSAHSNPAVANQLPALYIQANAADRAQAAYRWWIHSNPRDIAAYSGLGRLELNSGDYRTASETFEHALRLDPRNPNLEKQVLLARRALHLDPTPRQLASSEKLARSEAILAMAVDAAHACNTRNPDETTNLLQKLPRSPTNEDSEKRLDAAGVLFRSLPRGCAPPDDAELLTVLMRKSGS